MFKIRNLRFKGILSIDKLDFHKDQVTVIIGRSGSGKSTLLRMLNGLNSPDSGTIEYKGKSLDEYDPTDLRREVTMLLQEPISFPGSVRDNLVKGFEFQNREAPSDVKLKKMLEIVHLDKDLDESPSKFSNGEKQRLALGRVLLLQPQVLLLDEPSSALDQDTTEEVIESILDYADSLNITVIMISHSKFLIENFAERIIEIGDGRVIDDKIGQAGELKAKAWIDEEKKDVGNPETGKEGKDGK